MKKFKIGLFISVLAHAGLLFWGSLKNETSTLAIKAQRELHAHHGETVKVTLRIDESELPKIEKVLKATRKVYKKPVVKRVVSKPTPIEKTQKAQAKRNEVQGKESLNQYISELRQFIENQKYYPRKAARLKQSGSVEIDIEIDQHGHFVKIEIKRPSHYSTLNKAALRLVQEINRFKPLPNEMGEKVVLSVPLKYQLKK